MDEIRIKNLEVFAFHGVYREENVLGQKFLVDAALFLDTRRAGLTDELECSVSYGDVCRLIDREMKSQNAKLLECVAEHLADQILHTFSSVKEVEIEIKKPWAPVRMHMDYASVRIKRKWHDTFIGVGSNMGDRKQYINNAENEIRSLSEIRNLRMAPVIETEPYGYTNQGKFLNTVFSFETLYTPEELLEELHRIEKNANRERKIHWGPRTLDLDILLYDDLITQEEKLTIPHPEMTKRLFVLEPLCHLYPQGIHPLLHRRFMDIYEELKKEEQENG